jgi:hypothetical protein
MWIQNHPVRDLAKFGYSSKRKVENIKNLLEPVISKYDNFKKNPSKYGNFGQFFPKKGKSIENCSIFRSKDSIFLNS